MLPGTRQKEKVKNRPAQPKIRRGGSLDNRVLVLDFELHEVSEPDLGQQRSP